MIVDIVLSVLVAVLVLLLFNEYLVWANNYRLENPFEENSLLPPKAVSDSQRYMAFWTEYYMAKYL
jgi:hypothetical protein